MAMSDIDNVNFTLAVQLYEMLHFQGAFGGSSYVIVMVFSLLGNGLVIGSCAMNRKFRTSTHFLLMNLSAADLLYIFVIFIDGSTLMLWRWPFGSAMCSIMFMALNVALYIRIYTLVLLTVEQSLMLCYPEVNRRPMYWIILSVLWVMMILSNILGPMTGHLMANNFYPWDDAPHPQCTVWIDVLSEYWWGLFIFAYSVPLIAIGVVESVMLRRWFCDYIPARASPNFTEIKRTTITCGVMVMLFAALWLPLYVTMLTILRSDPEADGIVQVIDSGSKVIICKVIASVEMCINPLLYAIIIPSFRHQFWLLLTCGCCCGDDAGRRKARGDGCTELQNIGDEQATAEGSRCLSEQVYSISHLHSVPSTSYAHHDQLV
ncbi:PREDICTED: nociceptin receptor-like [Priapulus caudatus]|uniref:Nociceptin receptor-like n=1 Tax=Priapulus caudatus TaxID=37621 RepID=A0ABM1EZG6_PRICU|nr:PREDICTED: nociceptin receptor-like [Priapulus caudatus]